MAKAIKQPPPDDETPIGGEASADVRNDVDSTEDPDWLRADPKRDSYPSVAYRQVCRTLVYRLSEAMFASLLAAYVIGFVSVAGSLGWAPAASPEQNAAHQKREANAASENLVAEDFPLLGLIRLFNTVVISFSFALFTTGIYLKFQMAIMTMPSYRLENINRDFLFAVGQGLFFGFAMIYPVFLIPIIGSLAVAGLFIQRHEAYRVIDWIARNLLNPNYLRELQKRFPDRTNEKKVAEAQNDRILDSFRCFGFDDWTPSRIALHLIFVIVSIITVIAFLAAIYMQVFFIESALRHVVVLFANFVAMLIIFFVVSHVIRRSGSFFFGPNRGMDKVKENAQADSHNNQLLFGINVRFFLMAEYLRTLQDESSSRMD